MVTSVHGREATLGCAVQRDLGCDISDGYDDPIGDLGAGIRGVQQGCGAEAVV